MLHVLSFHIVLSNYDFSEMGTLVFSCFFLKKKARKECSHSSSTSRAEPIVAVKFSISGSIVDHSIKFC